jgi:hypothetical protein
MTGILDGHPATAAKLLHVSGWPAVPLSHTVHNGYRRIHAILRKGLGQAMLACGLLLPAYAPAGGGPENVLLVVNGDSAVSMQIANRYIELRDIPQEHVVRLQDIPYPDRISIRLFRQRIWKPIRDFITRNRLEEEIDLIVYSTGFPYAVNFSADLGPDRPQAMKYLGSEASLTGLTYFARHVETGSTAYLTGAANRYFRRKLAPARYLPRVLTDEETRLHDKARKALRQNDVQTAVAGYSTLVEQYPEHGGLWHELARSYGARGNAARAMAALEQAVNQGWTNSLETRNDGMLQLLAGERRFEELLARMEHGNGPFQAAHGFSAGYEWAGATWPVKTLGSGSLNSYYLSTLLAYTGNNGNSVPEVERYLAASRNSDGTRPDGTVYLLANRNVRSRTRQPLFLATVAALESRGQRAEILTSGESGQDGILPRGKQDVIGAVVGAKKYDWQASGSRLLPGAIAESLTSYGGQFNNHSQTKLTEFLRHGAAGSTGAVAEPFSIQAKFPVPLLHSYYADGCSLAEAIYQSVESPYQLLVVGDPLARPYASFARVALASPDQASPWSGVTTIKPAVIPVAGRPIAHLELWVDGQLLAYARPGETISWDTRGVDDGYHELRLVAQESDPVETRSYARLGVVVANTAHRIEPDPQDKPVRHGETIIVSGAAASAREVSLWQGARRLTSGQVSGNHWKLEIDSSQLGIGPVTLGVRASFHDNTVVRSKPLKLDIAPPLPVGSPLETRNPNRESGTLAAAQQEDGMETVRLSGNLRNYSDTTHLSLEGQLVIERAGFYELVVTAPGEISLAVDNTSLLSNQALSGRETRFLPVSLQPGVHRLDIEFSPAGRQPHLKLMIEGEQVALMPKVRVVSAIRNAADTQP